MTRAKSVDTRFDFRGGTNTSHSSEILERTEVRFCQNGRPGPVYGALQKVAGTQRIHDTAMADFGTNVQGVRVWDGAGTQIVAVAALGLWSKTLAAANFTQNVSNAFAANGARFAQHRTSGGAIKLFIAEGSGVRSWDGAVLSGAIAGAPTAFDIAVYKGRLFASNRTKTLYASKVGDPLTWAAGSGGFFGDVETYDAEGIQGIIVVGGSLLVCKADNIARFTGIDQNDIRIDVQTEGLSQEDGLIAPYTLIDLEGGAFGVGARGPWIATEAGLDINLGLAIEDQFDFADRTLWQKAVAVHDRGRKCVRLSIPAIGDGANRTTWEYNYRTRTWSGPRITPFAISAACRYKKADNTETTLVGGPDGFVREMEVTAIGAKDDVHRDGTGGSNIALDVQLPPILSGDPSRVKSLRSKSSIQADLGAAGLLEMWWESEMGSDSVFVPTKGAGLYHYPYKTFAKGARITTGIREATSAMVQINGVWQPTAESRKQK